MKQIDNTPIEDLNIDWGDPDGTGKKAKSLEQVQAFLKKHMNNGYKYISTATPSTTPVTITGCEKVFYIATEEGDYANYGLGAISELSVIKSENGSWKVEGSGVPMNIKVTINNKVDKSFDLRNILNPEWIHWGGIWQNNSYRAISSSYGYTDLIPCAYPNKLIVYKALADGDNVTFSVYDSNGTYLRQIKAPNSSNTTALFTSQEGDYFIRINLNGGSAYQNHANYGETLNEYVPYNGNPIFGYLQDFVDGYLQELGDVKGDVAAVNERINNKVDESFDLRNILNPDWIHWGGIWQNNSYRAISSSYGYTDLIPCAYPNKLIVYKALADGGNVTFSVYDSNGTYLRQIKAPNSSNTTALFTSQEGDYFIRINLNGGSAYQNHANYGETLNEYVPYNGNPIFGYLQDFVDGYLQEFVGITPKIKYSISSFISSVICIGDSMTAGVIGTLGTFNNYSYPTYLSRITGWTIENTGTGGQTPRGWWSGKFSNYAYTDYEIAIIYLGQNEGLTETLDADTFDGTTWAPNTTYAVNDIVLYNKIGRKCIEAHTSGETFDDSKWSNAYTNYADTNTGCYCKIIEGMLIQNPLLKIFLLCGTSVSSWEDVSRGRVISQISERYALPVFNIKNNAWINLLNTSYHPYNDNIHYGPMGYNALARVIYAYLMKHFTEHEYEFNTWPILAES